MGGALNAWPAAAAAVRGRSHERSGAPCQDAVLFLHRKGFVTVALADGAGSALHADVGARVAVAAAVRALEELFHALQPGQPGAGERHAILVFDDEDTSTLKNINRWIRAYFSETRQGLARSQVVVPAPFYVRSCVTPLIVLPDLVAYCLAWGWRGTTTMVEPAREDLSFFVREIENLRAECGKYQDDAGTLKPRHAIYYVKDLRTS